MICCLGVGCVEKDITNPPKTEQPIDENLVLRNEILQKIEQMSLDEKIGQMIISGVEGKTANRQTKQMIQDQSVGGVIFYKDNISSSKGLVAYVNQLKQWNQNNPFPLFISIDEEGGNVSRLPGLEKIPTAKEIGNTEDSDYAAKVGRFLGSASKLMGINVDYAPVLDINSNPKNPVIGVRSYGTTVELVSKMGREVMKGIQDTGTISIIKHFPGHGDTSVDSHLELPVVHKNLKQLQSFEWIPFADAIQDGADAVMIAHILFPQIDSKYPASLSKTIITDQLRGTLGFKGVVITDDLTMGAIRKHYGIDKAAIRTVKAGSDILLVAHNDNDNVTKIISALKKSVIRGEISEDRINESVFRILMLKEKYKLTDQVEIPIPDLTNINADIRKEIAKH